MGTSAGTQRRLNIRIDIESSKSEDSVIRLKNQTEQMIKQFAPIMDQVPAGFDKTATQVQKMSKAMGISETQMTKLIQKPKTNYDWPMNFRMRPKLPVWLTVKFRKFPEV